MEHMDILIVAQDVERKIICNHLGIKRNTLVSYVKLFLAEGLEGLKSPQLRHRSVRESMEVFSVHAQE